MTKSVCLALGCVLFVCRPAAAQPTQPVYLQYDGFVRNANGTLTVSFGYYNMNNVDVTVPPGDANSFAPAPNDRNQPVTFAKGRHRFVCSMVVDNTFDGKLQWTLKFAGKTQTTTAKALDPLYELELNSQKKANANLDIENAPKNVCINRPPTPEIVNPFGGNEPITRLAAKVDQDLAINARVEDDGLPRGSTVTATWKKATGPGTVTFSNTASAPTRAKFSAPGTYEIELTASDGEKTSTLKVTVTVS